MGSCGEVAEVETELLQSEEGLNRWFLPVDWLIVQVAVGSSADVVVVMMVVVRTLELARGLINVCR